MYTYFRKSRSMKWNFMEGIKYEIHIFSLHGMNIHWDILDFGIYWMKRLDKRNYEREISLSLALWCILEKNTYKIFLEIMKSRPYPSFKFAIEVYRSLPSISLEWRKLSKLWINIFSIHRRHNFLKHNSNRDDSKSMIVSFFSMKWFVD